MGQLLVALDMWFGPTSEIAVLGELESEDTAEALSELRRRYIPNRVVACRSDADQRPRSSHLDPLFAGKSLADIQPAVYICQSFTCDAPVYGLDAAKVAWERLTDVGE
jgi:uncharacterized protein YyaL (SSP411 family)